MRGILVDSSRRVCIGAVVARHLVQLVDVLRDQRLQLAALRRTTTRRAASTQRRRLSVLPCIRLI
jgi:hypothetical protein